MSRSFNFSTSWVCSVTAKPFFIVTVEVSEDNVLGFWMLQVEIGMEFYQFIEMCRGTS